VSRGIVQHNKKKIFPLQDLQSESTNLSTIPSSIPPLDTKNDITTM